MLDAFSRKELDMPVSRRRFQMSRFLLVVGSVGLAMLGLAVRLPARQAAAVDAIFARWTTATPGCSVGASVTGRVVVNKAYGMADLEHDVPNTPDTIFEAGSVSKQFTAAGVLLLAREGKLSLDDPVRKYVPELPDYGSPLLIRHMLMHMSGLRDWGGIEAIAGWPRSTRVYTHAHVLDIVSRQKSLNFTPGSQYSYSNTGYNLAAIIVTRVSGMPFAEFEKQRLFTPLGMTHTSWRDDFTRIVRSRAIAYAQQADGFHQQMPFENIHGNGGLLTTVGDLLKWNENFVAPVVGDASFVAEQQRPGAFNDGKPGSYALGLVVGTYRGAREVGHSGSTAGYRAHLVRYPDQGVSVAVLCNGSTGGATQYAHAVAELLMPGVFAPAPPAAARPRAAAPPPRVTRTAEELAPFAGTYVSDEAETTLVAAVIDGALALKRRPDTVMRLTPTATTDVFTGSIGTITFRRDAGGRVIALSIGQDRVFDLRFDRR
jgi:CubicO group peptidase (beta-lactamase class C family)